jgi:hypothetical protein
VTVPEPAPAPFASLDELRKEHGRLLKGSKEEAKSKGTAQSVEPAADPTHQIVRFLARAQLTGTRLDFPADREAAQSVLDYWTATLFTLPNGVSAASTLPSLIPGVTEAAVNLQLAAFDPAALREAVAEADAWLARPGADRVLARRILLRLVRLRPNEPVFDATPTVTAALTDLDTQERVAEVLAGLAKAGVIRVTRVGTDELERVALRSPELMTDWPALKDRLADRLAFRREAERWAASGRPVSGLADGERLEDARRFHDRNAIEREYVVESAYRQAQRAEQAEAARRQAEADRRAKWVWRGLAAAAVIGWVFAAVGWARSTNWAEQLEWRNNELRTKSEQLVTANKELDRESKELSKATGERQAISDRLDRLQKARLRWLTAAQLTRALGELVAARTPSERALASDRVKFMSDRTKETGVLNDLLTPETTDAINGVRDAPEKYAHDVLAVGRKVADEARKNADMAEYLTEMRQVPYRTAMACADQLVKLAESKRPLTEGEAFAREFWTLYWGEMVMVEGRDVEIAMVKFGGVLGRIDKKAEAISNEELDAAVKKLAPALGKLVLDKERLTQLIKELRVRGGTSPLLNDLVRDLVWVPPSDDDVRDLIKARDALRTACLAELGPPDKK